MMVLTYFNWPGFVNAERRIDIRLNAGLNAIKEIFETEGWR